METQIFHSEQSGLSRTSWAGIWAGLFAGIGMQIVLTALGLGIGLTSAESSAAAALKDLPLSVEVWSGFAWVLSVFIGGYVAAWMSGASLRADGVFHGLATWGVMLSVLFCSATAALGVLLVKGFAAVPPASVMKAASWWLFGGGIVSLGCAYLGGSIGVRAAHHRIEEVEQPALHRAA